MRQIRTRWRGPSHDRNPLSFLLLRLNADAPSFIEQGLDLCRVLGPITDGLARGPQAGQNEQKKSPLKRQKALGIEGGSRKSHEDEPSKHIHGHVGPPLAKVTPPSPQGQSHLSWEAMRKVNGGISAHTLGESL